MSSMCCAGKAHSLRVLYLDASSAKYVESADKKRMLDSVCNAVAKLSVEQCIQILEVMPKLSRLALLATVGLMFLEVLCLQMSFGFQSRTCAVMSPPQSTANVLETTVHMSLTSFMFSAGLQ